MPKPRLKGAQGALHSESAALADKSAGACYYAAADIDGLVRELDLSLNGPDGAARAPKLCDLVGQIKDDRWQLVRKSEGEFKPCTIGHMGIHEFRNVPIEKVDVCDYCGLSRPAASLTLTVDVDTARDLVTICGVTYAGNLFRAFSVAKPGKWFRIEQRHDDNLYLFSVPPETERTFDAITRKGVFEGR